MVYLERDVVMVRLVVVELTEFVAIGQVLVDGVGLFAVGKLMTGVLLQRFKLFVGSNSIFVCSLK